MSSIKIYLPIYLDRLTEANLHFIPFRIIDKIQNDLSSFTKSL